MTELPRCAVCRVSVQIGQQLTFRPDGRVQHRECPRVTCPVCEREIRPHEPIRRDGEHLLHGNCWLRRYRASERGTTTRREAQA
jgi:hypothetical protein